MKKYGTLHGTSWVASNKGRMRSYEIANEFSVALRHKNIFEQLNICSVNSNSELSGL